MARERYTENDQNKRNSKYNPKYIGYDENDEFVRRKEKRSGKRFHRKKTIRENYLSEDKT